MAIVFSEQKKKQQNLILVFILVLLGTGLVLWLGIFKKPENPEEIFPDFFQNRVEIDFSVLENPIFSELELFKDFFFFDGKAGRDNPYLPR